MDYVPLVRVGTLYPFLKVLLRAGCPVHRHLDACRLLRQVQELDAEEFVPFANVLKFLESSSRREGIEDLGFLAGSQSKIHDMGAFGHLVLREPTVLSALRRAHQLGNSYNTSVHEWMNTEGNNVRCFRQFRVPSQVGLSHADHFIQMLTLNSFRFFEGSRWRPAEMGFQSRPPASLDLESEIGARVVCSQSASSMLIPRSILARRISPVEGTAKAGESRYFEPAPDNPLDSLRCVIKAQLFEGAAEIHLTAEAAGMSVRTLQRRLVEDGLTYSALVDEVRFELAVLSMQDANAKMIDIALDLGYENPGSFTRAFRRWSGFSPVEFRELNFGAEAEMVESASQNRSGARTR